MELSVFCQNHDNQYAQYCVFCEEMFCDSCPPHNEHATISILNALTSDIVKDDTNRCNNLLTTIAFALGLIQEAVDKLLKVYTEEGNQDTPSPIIQKLKISGYIKNTHMSQDPEEDTKEDYNPLNNDKEEFSTKKERELKVDEQLKMFAVITGEYDNAKAIIQKWYNHLNTVRAEVNSNDMQRVARALLSMKGFKKTMAAGELKIEELGKKVEEISKIHFRQEIWQKQTFAKFHEFTTRIERLIPKIGDESLKRMWDHLY